MTQSESIISNSVTLIDDTAQMLAEQIAMFTENSFKRNFPAGLRVQTRREASVTSSGTSNRLWHWRRWKCFLNRTGSEADPLCSLRNPSWDFTPFNNKTISSVIHLWPDVVAAQSWGYFAIWSVWVCYVELISTPVTEDLCTFHSRSCDSASGRT